MDSETGKGAGLSFNFDATAGALIASVAPNPAAQPIDEAWLRSQIEALGYAHLRYLPTAATVLLAKYNSGAAVTLRLAESVDASFDIALSNDALEARLVVQPAQGGKALSLEVVLQALAEKGISEGILPEAIVGALAGNEKETLVARGRAAEHGKDGYLASLLPEVRSRAPRVTESGHTDYRDLGDILVVHPGDMLMVKHPPTEGRYGMTLLGEAIPAKPGKDVMYSANLPGTQFDAQNPNLLLAAIAGQPVVVRGGAIVEPIFKLDEVGTASGNITYDGSVVIKGDVAAGMTVRASGDIQIGGTADIATLDAGGSIVIKGGAIGGLGRKSGSEHFIRCGGCFTAGFAQQAKIEAGDSIFVDDMAMQCELAATNHIRVGNARRGHIIGGIAHATLSITAKVIGSPNRVKTRFEIGVNPQMHKELLEKAKLRDETENKLLEISKLMDFASKNPGKLRPEMLEKARATAATLSATIASLREEQEGLNAKIELSQQSRVVAEQAMYEGVEVLMGNQRYRVVGQQGPGAIGLGRGGLGLLALEDATKTEK